MVFYNVYHGLNLHGTVGTLKMIPTTYPASALTVPITAISIPLRKGCGQVCPEYVIGYSHWRENNSEKKRSILLSHI